VKLFDSHLHLTDPAFAEDRDAVLLRARKAGVSSMVTVASNAEDARAAAALARVTDGVWATAGLHPHEARDWNHGVMTELRELVDRPEVVALGETGLDFFYDNSPRREQAESFEAHLELAVETDLPVVVHSREADDETASFIRRFAGRARGVLHCFAGGPALLTAGLDAGWHISFSGLVTFRSFGGAELARRVPRERLLIETDSPYLAPAPRRGRRNEPALVAHVCRALAALRGEAAEDVARTTFANACSFYGVEESR
jgi:TatD DNase family protein